MIGVKDSMSANRYAKFVTDIVGLFFLWVSSYKQAFIHGESYEKWIKKTRLDIDTGS